MTRDVSRRGVLGGAVSAPLWISAASAATPLPVVAGQRRLFFTPAALARARTLKQSGILANAWTTLRSAVATAHKKALSSFATTTDPTRWWQRYVGWSMSNLAAAYLLDGDTADRDLAIELATTAADYTIWGGSNAIYDGDLNASDQLFGISMVVDWLGAEMPAATLAKLVACLRSRGAHMATFATGIGGDPAWWWEDWLQNHMWDNVAGLLATGLALQPHAPADAATFIDAAMSRVQQGFPVLMPDGGTQESPAYWEFTAESVLKIHALVTEVLGRAMDGPWLQHAASYRLAMRLPDQSLSPSQVLINQADAGLVSWFGPEYQLRRLASLNRDGFAQAYAAQLEAANLVYPAAPWLNFVWYDETVPPPTKPAPLMSRFKDMDLVVARTDHSGHEAVVVMRAGSAFGRQAITKKYPDEIGLGHVHPDINHVTLFASGKFLLRDDGYVPKKLTVQHNTLLVNGRGQFNDGSLPGSRQPYPMPDLQPTLTLVQNTGALDYWVGAGAPAYPSSAKLTTFNRHVLFIKPDVLVVIDELEAAAVTSFTLLWHPGIPVTAGATPTKFVAADDTARMYMSFVGPKGAMTTLGSRQYALSTQPSAPVVPEIQTVITAQAAQSGAVFAWGATGSTVTLWPSLDSWVVTVGVRTVTLYPKTRQVVMA